MSCKTTLLPPWRLTPLRPLDGTTATVRAAPLYLKGRTFVRTRVFNGSRAKKVHA